MRLTVQHTLADVMEGNRTVREQRLKGWLAIIFGVVWWLLAAWYLLALQNQRDSLILFWVGAAWIVVGLVATRVAGLGAWLFKSNRVPSVLDIDGQGVAFVENDKLYRVPWSLFRRWCKTENLLILIARGDFVLIPRRACTDTQWHDLLGLVQNGLGAPARW